MNKLIIKNARVIDPYTDIDGTFDILIESERVIELKSDEREGIEDFSLFAFRKLLSVVKFLTMLPKIRG